LNPLEALKLIKTLAMYVPKYAPNFESEDVASLWVKEIAKYDYRQVCELFGRIKTRSEFPGLGEVLTMLGQTSQIRLNDAIDIIALQILGKLCDGRVISPAAAIVWGINGGATGFAGLNVGDQGSLRTIRAVVAGVLAANEVSLSASDLAVTDREALPSTTDSSSTASDAQREDFQPITKEQWQKLKSKMSCVVRQVRCAS
jgi:hypothetical protein